MPDDEWWNEFFSEPWSRVQAGGYPADRTATECDLIQSALDLAPGAEVLDIPCGIGRHSIELARRGFRVTGVDFKAQYIELARSRAAHAAGAPRFVVADMRDFVSTDVFDAAFCYFGSFGYFWGEDDLRFVRAVHGALKPGGRFVVEGHIAETLLPVYRERDWFWADPPQNSRQVLEERAWNVESSRVEATWTIIDDDGTQTATTSIRIYSFRELQALLELGGFANVIGRDGKTGGPLRVGSPRALIIAEKRRP